MGKIIPNEKFHKRIPSGSRPECSPCSKKLFGVPKKFFLTNLIREGNTSGESSFGKKSKRLLLCFIFISFSLILFRPFIVSQMAIRGDGYFGYSMYGDAIRQYKKALLLDPRNSRIMNWLGYAYSKKGDKNRAIDTYKKAIEIDPQNIMAYYDLGMMYLMNKEYEVAKEHFLKASVISHDRKKITKDEYSFYHLTALEMMSHCREKLGEIEDAIKTNEKILEYYPNDHLAQKRAKERIKRLNTLRRSNEAMAYGTPTCR